MPSAGSFGDSTHATTARTSGVTAPSPARPRSGSSAVCRPSAMSVFALLLAFRIVNSLTLCTLFVPDEYFQSLEPAWRTAFGPDSGAWITWEWKSQLRSSLNTGLFAAVYLAAASIGRICGLSPSSQAELLIVVPKITQATFAALLDLYTWKLAERAFGRGSRTALTTLALSTCSPWQWFCSTRTLSNSLETTITSVAVYYWPWDYPGTARDERKKNTPRASVVDELTLGPLSHLRVSLLLAALACILRPTNGLIWITLSIPTLWQISLKQRYILLREILLCGSAVVIISVVCDRLYYQTWTFPPLRFLYFNIAQSLAVFYGTNRPDYYFTEGLPLLLTTALPFAALGLVEVLRGGASSPGSDATSDNVREAASQTVPRERCLTTDTRLTRRILTRLAWTSIFTTIAFSLISHKEVRFLYPVLPFLHLIASPPLYAFVQRARPPKAWRDPSFNPSHILSRRLILSILLIFNLTIATFVSFGHQPGVIDVLTHLRHTHEARTSTQGATTKSTVAFLMPCHSTPWRSHLVHRNIDAWALTCEPPIDIPLANRSSYLDEADQFYISPGPKRWLAQNMASVASVQAGGSRSGQYWAGKLEGSGADGKGRRAWPQHLVFFEHLEDTMREVLRGSRYKECWRGFNSFVHDDSRRRGDVVVWCLE